MTHEAFACTSFLQSLECPDFSGRENFCCYFLCQTKCDKSNLCIVWMVDKGKLKTKELNINDVNGQKLYKQ